MPLFDHYLAIDWSAASRPKRGPDSVWVSADGELHNPATREVATRLVRGLLIEAVTAGRRVLVGWDFAFAYPAGTAARLGLGSWREIWALLANEIFDGPDNTNNRFAVAGDLNRRMGFPAGPFWACPPAAAGPHLATRRGDVTELGEYRACERWLRANGRAVHSPWKLFTTGSVGGQTLLGIPRLHALRTDPELAPHSAIWPFETDISMAPPAPPSIWHAELWPPGFPIDHASHGVRDAAQVHSVTVRLRALDRAGQLERALAVPAIDEIAEEGWVLSDPGWSR